VEGVAAATRILDPFKGTEACGEALRVDGFIGISGHPDSVKPLDAVLQIYIPLGIDCLPSVGTLGGVSNPAEGNDDPISVPDENANPYQACTDRGLVHAIGEISSADGPRFLITNAVGVEGATFGNIANFWEFARLEITASVTIPGERGQSSHGNIFGLIWRRCC
jgi:hypothetical protein